MYFFDSASLSRASTKRNSWQDARMEARRGEVDPAEWSALMSRAQDGDQAAYERLLRDIVPFIRSVVAGQQQTPDRIDEVVQDVLITVHRVRHTYDPARPFKPWLAAIARRRSIDRLRRRRRTESVEVHDPHAYETFADAKANNLAEAHGVDRNVRSAIAALPAQQREAVELLKMRELSLAEASELSGRSIAALKVNVHRAIKSLRKQLGGV